MRVFDKDKSEELKAKSWQIELLHLNPRYTFWGPHEDYMAKEPGKGWDTPCFINSWKEFNDSWGLDELNECVNFYFEVVRDNQECSLCRGSGYNPETQKIADSFYYGENKWVHKITQDEVDALWRYQSLKGFQKETDRGGG